MFLILMINNSLCLFPRNPRIEAPLSARNFSNLLKLQPWGNRNILQLGQSHARVKYFLGLAQKDTDRQIERQTDRQIERQTDR